MTEGNDDTREMQLMSFYPSLHISFLDELNKNDMFWTINYFLFFLRSKGMCKDSVNAMSECEIVNMDCYVSMIEQRIKEC